MEIKTAYFESPIGLLEIQSEKGRVSSLHFVKEKRYKKEEIDSILIKAKEQLMGYFSGERKKFDLALKMNGSEFQKNVWSELVKIPYGETLSYKEIAVAIGNKNAYRAVGNANNKNNIVIIIPCHRVVGSAGKLGGYGTGVWRKKWLIEHEKKYKD